MSTATNEWVGNSEWVKENLHQARTIAIDFDGVLHDHSDDDQGWIPRGKPIKGAANFIWWLSACNIKIVIHSCRADDPGGTAAIWEWLIKHGFPVDLILFVTSEKPIADWYLDDRAIRFTGEFDAAKSAMLEPVWFRKGE